MKRKLCKDNGEPLQEVYKIFINTIYGVLASQFLTTNNPVAANYITSTARCATWMMNNALNGCQSITDGSTFSWGHVPVGLSFKGILKANPDYPLAFDDSISSGIDDKEQSQDWITNSFKSHVNQFFECDSSVIDIFDFTLKSEKFESKEGSIKTTIFTKFINSSAGDYLKGIDGNQYLTDEITGNSGYYNFDNQYTKLKARGFRTDQKDIINDSSLTNWYRQCLEYDQYLHPYIYEEKGIYNLSDGTQAAERHLNKEGVIRCQLPSPVRDNYLVRLSFN